jgi:two-component system, LytTR family, response regulator
MIQAILIDDEPNNTAYVRALLHEHFPQVSIELSCNDSTQAMAAIAELRPQLVFLDIEMPTLNGFELLQKLEPLSFEVIFVTAYDFYALQAFDVNAIGYLTKPVQVEKFIRVTNAAIRKIEGDQINKSLFSLLQANMSAEHRDKIALPTQKGLQFVNPGDILYCHSSGNYTKFLTKDGKSILVSRQLGEFERLLSSDDFHRIHDQYIVRLQYIREYVRGRGGELIMDNNDSLPVSVKRKDAFLSRFEKWLRKG